METLRDWNNRENKITLIFVARHNLGLYVLQTFNFLLSRRPFKEKGKPNSFAIKT